MNKKNLSKALEDLDSAFENLEVKPLSANDLGRVAGGETAQGVTCNSKCGPTAYWECATYHCSYTCGYTTYYVDGYCVS